MYVQLDEENRIVASSENSLSIPNAIEINLPAEFDFCKQRDYIVENRKLLHSPEYESAHVSSPSAVPETLSDIEATLIDLQKAVSNVRSQLESQ